MIIMIRKSRKDTDTETTVGMIILLEFLFGWHEPIVRHRFVLPSMLKVSRVMIV